MSFLEKISDDSTIKGRIIITCTIIFIIGVIVFIPMGIGLLIMGNIPLKVPPTDYYGASWVIGFLSIALPAFVSYLLYSFIHWIITGD